MNVSNVFRSRRFVNPMKEYEEISFDRFNLGIVRQCNSNARTFHDNILILEMKKSKLMVQLAEARMLREVDDSNNNQEEDPQDDIPQYAVKGAGVSTIRSIHRNRALNQHPKAEADDELPNWSTFVHYE